MFNKSRLLKIRLNSLLLLFSLLVLFYPSFAYCQATNQLIGRVVEAADPTSGIENVQINAYVAPRKADGSMEWRDSTITDSNGYYTFTNTDLDSCSYFLEANAWETRSGISSPFVNLYYGGGGQYVKNGNRAVALDVCAAGAVTLNFTLSNGGSVSGIIYDGSGNPVSGMRVKASAILSYIKTTQITVTNDPEPPDWPTWTDSDGDVFELVLDEVTMANHVYLTDTYSKEIYTETDINGKLQTLCNSRSGTPDGSYLLQGLDIPEPNTVANVISSELLLEVDANSSRCGIPFHYQQSVMNTSIPSAGTTTANTNFTLNPGYEITGSITTTPGASLCNTTLALYRDSIIYMTTVNIADDGTKTEVPFLIPFDKLTSIKELNTVLPDFPDDDPRTGYVNPTYPGVHLTCDNFNDWVFTNGASVSNRYTADFTFNNLEEGDYYVEYMEDYIYSVHQRFPASGYASVSAGQTSANIPVVVDTLVVTDTMMPAPRVFYNQNSGCSQRVACWVTGHPPASCPSNIMVGDVEVTMMNKDVCNDYTSGNNFQVYDLDERPTHYFIDFYDDDICSNLINIHTVNNYIMPYQVTKRTRKLPDQSNLSSTEVELDKDASSTTGYYNGMTFQLIGGAGAPGEVSITNYAGPTRICTVSPPFTTPPVFEDNFTIYAINNWETFDPRRCECYTTANRTTYNIRAFNIFNTDTSTNSSSSICYTVGNNIDESLEFASADDFEDAQQRLASINSEDFLSNTVAKNKSFSKGLTLENDIFSPRNILSKKTKNMTRPEIETVQLAGLNWVDYLFNLLKKIAGKVLYPGQLVGDDGFFLGGGSGIDLIDNRLGNSTSAQVSSGGIAPGFPDLALLDYAISNLEDCDERDKNGICVGDGLPDYWEDCQGLDKTSIEGDDGTYGDPDGDGLPNYWEYFYGTDPLNGDTDGDGMPDDWEVLNELNPLLDDSADDPDGNGLTNLIEYLNRTEGSGLATVYYVDAGFVREGEPEIITGARDDPFGSIEEALASIFDGIIKVVGGDYSLNNGNLTVGAGIRLIGDSAATTKIDLLGNQIILENGGALIGFTIENPPASDPAVVVSSAYAKIANNVILGSNKNDDTGISLFSSSSDVLNNLIWGFASGIYLEDSASSIQNNIIGSCDSSIIVSPGAPGAPVIDYNNLFRNVSDPVLNDTTRCSSNVDPEFVDPESADPGFVSRYNFHLKGDSDLRDAGNCLAIYNDADSSLNDIGPDGGPFGPIDRNVPFAAVSASETIINTGNYSGNKRFSFDATLSTDEWGIATYEWAYEATGIYSFNDDELGTLVCDFDKDNVCGDRRFVLTITDHNNFSTTISTIVTLSQGPGISSFNVIPDMPVVNEDTGMFSGSGAGTISWKVDNEPITEDTYIFTAPGLYDVEMSVVDSSGCESLARKLVTVVDKYINEPVSLPIGPEGYTLNNINPDNPLHGIEVEIPPNALSETIDITISEPSTPPGLPAGFTGVGIPFDLGPDGISFSLPVRITIPYDLTQTEEENAENLRVLRYDAAAAEWEEASVVDIIETDQDTGFLVVRTNHFSSYQVISAPKPAPPIDLTATAIPDIRINLAWRYSSTSYIDGFIVQRSEDRLIWRQIAEVDKNTLQIYEYTDMLDTSCDTFYYRVIAFRYRVVASEDKIKSEPSDVAIETCMEFVSEVSCSDGKDNDCDEKVDCDDSDCYSECNQTRSVNTSADDTSQAAAGESGVGFGCALVRSGSGSGINPLVQLLVLFFPLFILRWRSLRLRVADWRMRIGKCGKENS